MAFGFGDMGGYCSRWAVFQAVQGGVQSAHRSGCKHWRLWRWQAGIGWHGWLAADVAVAGWVERVSRCRTTLRGSASTAAAGWHVRWHEPDDDGGDDGRRHGGMSVGGGMGLPPNILDMLTRTGQGGAGQNVMGPQLPPSMFSRIFTPPPPGGYR